MANILNVKVTQLVLCYFHIVNSLVIKYKKTKKSPINWNFNTTDNVNSIIMNIVTAIKKITMRILIVNQFLDFIQ